MRPTTTRFRMVLALILALTLAAGGTAALAASDNVAQSMEVAAPAADHLVINEFIATPTGDEAIELYNPTASPVDVSNWTVAGGTISSGQVVPADGYLVLTSGTNAPGMGIPNAGDAHELRDGTGTLIDKVSYGRFGAAPKPFFATAAVRAPNGVDTDDDAADWTWTATYTLGAANTAPAANLGSSVVINEVNANSGSAFIELYNPTASPVALDGWMIAVDDDYFIPASTTIEAGGFWVLNESDFPQFMSMGSTGDQIYLYDALAVRIDQVGWSSAAGAGKSWNRLPNGAGSNQGYNDASSQLVALAPTPGSGNTPVIINEVDADTPGTETDEFVELYDGGIGSTALDGLTVVLYNGSNDTSYRTVDLAGQTTDANGYFVIGGTGIVSAGLTITDDYWLQNGQDAVALYLGVPLTTAVTTTNLLDALVYDTADSDDPGLLPLLNPGQPQVDERGGGDGEAHSNQRCENGTGGARNTDTFIQRPPSPGMANDCPVAVPFGVCYDTTVMATPIHDVQSTGADSPLVGNIVILEGVVVGDFQSTTDELGGYFLQEEDAQADGDAATSEGIFVYDNGFSTDVAVGDVVRVQGTVAEGFGQTQLSSIMTATVCSSTGITVTPGVIDLPVADTADLEAFEGMLITVPEMLYVTELYTLGRYGEVWVSADARLMQPTQVITPGQPAIDLQAANDKARLLIDDGSSIQNPDTVPYIAPDNIVRGGDTVTGLTGVLGYGFNYYRVQPTGHITFTEANPRTAAPDVISGTLKVAAFNVLNYFNGDGQGGGFPTSRGADSAVEFERQRTKIITAMLSIDADIVGLMEIENDGYDQFSAIADLVSGLNAIAGTGVYTYVNPGTPMWGADEIAVAMIYKPASVTPIGASAGITTGIFDQVTNRYNRQPLAQTFAQNSNDERVTVVVNHFKSKGSDCSAVGDLDAGDGQGNCNVTRTTAATELAAWLATDPTGSGDTDYLVIGDLNSYGMEDPIMALQGAGYTDLARHFVGDSVYSYVFGGQWGTLDYAMSSSSLTSQVSGATVWHINADEGIFLDYNQEFNPAYVYSPDAYRSSDHDPVIVGLTLYTPKPALGISKSVALTNDPVKPGDAITYTLVISNSGDAVATDVRITDTLPAGLVGSSVDMTQTIAAGESYTITVSATVAEDVAASSTITNTAFFAHASGSGEASVAVMIRPVYSAYMPLVFKP